MNHDINYYISRGFNRPMAEYFAKGRKKLLSVTPKEDFTLVLEYEGGDLRLFDCKELLQPETVFEPLRNLVIFQRVYVDDTNNIAWDIDPEIDSNKVWNNKIDLSADNCYVNGTPLSTD